MCVVDSGRRRDSVRAGRVALGERVRGNRVYGVRDGVAQRDRSKARGPRPHDDRADADGHGTGGRFVPGRGRRGSKQAAGSVDSCDVRQRAGRRAPPSGIRHASASRRGRASRRRHFFSSLLDVTNPIARSRRSAVTETRRRGGAGINLTSRPSERTIFVRPFWLSAGPPGSAKVLPRTAVRVALRMQDL